MDELPDIPHRKKPGLARRLFRSVGQVAGKAVSGVTEGVLKPAGRTVKGAGLRVRLSFSGEVEESPPWEVREIAESLTEWLARECKGSADLQQQKPSTVELQELGQVQSFFSVVLEEPGVTGRSFRFVVRARPLRELESNLPSHQEQDFTAQLVIVREWPKELEVESKAVSFLVWDSAAAVGPRNAAQDLAQRWLTEELGGAFARKKVGATKGRSRQASSALLGREHELAAARAVLLTPDTRSSAQGGVLALAAPGGTGKSFFLRHLKASVEGRVLWAGVDHQGLADAVEPTEALGRILADLAKGLESQGLSMGSFRKEYFKFQQSRGKTEVKSGLFGHVRKALESAAGFNPALGAASAGAAFLASWGDEVKAQSESLARDDLIVALTRSFKDDLSAWSQKAKEGAILWRRPVLVFDTYEWLAPLVDVWLRTRLLSDDLFPECQAVVVVAGRDHPLKVNTRWAEFGTAMTVLELKPFPDAVARKFLEQLKAPPERWDELLKLTNGLPLFLSLAAHISNVDEAVSVLSERILEEVPHAARADFRRASLLEQFTASDLERLFPERTPEEREALLRQLDVATFTQAKHSRKSFTPAVGAILQRAFELEVGSSAYQKLQQSL